MGTHGTHAEACAILAAKRFTIHKADGGVAVGLQFDGGKYIEATSPDGDVDAAVCEAFGRLAHGTGPLRARPLCRGHYQPQLRPRPCLTTTRRSCRIRRVRWGSG